MESPFSKSISESQPNLRFLLKAIEVVQAEKNHVVVVLLQLQLVRLYTQQVST